MCTTTIKCSQHTITKRKTKKKKKKIYFLTRAAKTTEGDGECDFDFVAAIAFNAFNEINTFYCHLHAIYCFVRFFIFASLGIFSYVLRATFFFRAGSLIKSQNS